MLQIYYIYITFKNTIDKNIYIMYNKNVKRRGKTNEKLYKKINN